MVNERGGQKFHWVGVGGVGGISLNALISAFLGCKSYITCIIIGCGTTAVTQRHALKNVSVRVYVTCICNIQ